MRATYYAELDKVFSSIIEVACLFTKSPTIQNYWSEVFVSFFYANLISNIFDNINKTNARKYGLPVEEIVPLIKRYSSIK